MEKYIQGNDYRVLVVGDRVVAVSQRIPAHVIGDGEHTIGQLVELTNMDELRGKAMRRPLQR